MRYVLRLARATAAAAGLALLPTAWAAEFSVTPIRINFQPGVMSETVSVTNHAKNRLRVVMRLKAWTQDAAGKDIYTDSDDLIYFPRQMDLEPDSRRLVRVGLKSAPAGVERAYRLFIEEQPAAGETSNRAANVAIQFNFGVPVFVTPQGAQPVFEVGEPVLQKGRISLPVQNKGNRFVRLSKLTVSDGASWSQDVNGWYSLAGTTRTYTVDVPADICRRAKVLTIRLEGEGEAPPLDRKIDVTPASCG
jgi:fimbrial chaperone protein